MFNFKKQDEFEAFYARRNAEKMAKAQESHQSADMHGPETVADVIGDDMVASSEDFYVAKTLRRRHAYYLLLIALMAVGLGFNSYDLIKLKNESEALRAENDDDARMITELAKLNAALAERYSEQEELIGLMNDAITSQQRQINSLVELSNTADSGAHVESNDATDAGNYAPTGPTPKTESSVSDDPPAETWDGPSDKPSPTPSEKPEPKKAKPSPTPYSNSMPSFDANKATVRIFY